MPLPYSNSRQIYDGVGNGDVLGRQSRVDLFLHDARVVRDPHAKIVKRVWGVAAGLGVADAQSVLNETMAYWYT